MLRTFENKTATRTPTTAEINVATQKYPEMRTEIYIQPGKKLQDILQDGKSYRYGLIHLGGRDKNELYRKYEDCKRLLQFEFT